MRLIVIAVILMLAGCGGTEMMAVSTDNSVSNYTTTDTTNTTNTHNHTDTTTTTTTTITGSFNNISTVR